MTKLSLTLENKSCDSNVPQKGVIIKTEPSYSRPSDGEANILLKTLESEKNLIFSDIVAQEELVESKYEASGTILCIEEYTVVEANLDRNVFAVQKNVKALNVEDLKGESTSRLLKVSEEKMINNQNNALNFPPLWGLTSICGMRKEMEDYAVAFPRFLNIPSFMLGEVVSSSTNHDTSTAHLFAVYDGHGGFQVADYCRARLHEVVAEEIGTAKESWHTEPDYHNYEEKWTNIFLNSFHKMDCEVGGCLGGDIDCADNNFPSVAPNSVGSTALIAVICSTHIIVANCGDSRAVLCRAKVPIPLSVDHRPNSKAECARIEAAGGKVVYWNGYRVSGFLAVSRSIGDGYLKPYVVADPEVMFVHRAKEDDFLILASDGLWDVITNEEACELARRRILLWHKNNAGPNYLRERRPGIDPAAQDAADYLSRLALRKGSRDNISVIVIDLKARRKLKRKV